MGHGKVSRGLVQGCDTALDKVWAQEIVVIEHRKVLTMAHVDGNIAAIGLPVIFLLINHVNYWIALCVLLQQA